MGMIEFGEWLSKKREELGWSQRELARRVGMSNTHISMVEKGDTRVSYEFCEKIAQVFGAETEQVKRYAGLKGNTIPTEPESLPSEALLIADMIKDLDPVAKKQILTVVGAMVANEQEKVKAVDVEAKVLGGRASPSGVSSSQISSSRASPSGASPSRASPSSLGKQKATV